MDERVRRFLSEHHGAIVVTMKANGTPHVARVFVGLVEDKLWSSGTQGRRRTQHLRRNPQATLCVFEDGRPYRWLGLETRVTILDGADAPMQNLALYRVIAGEPDDITVYVEAMVAEQRLIYEFAIERVYGEF